MKKTIFDYTNYRTYLKAWIKDQPKGGRGMQRKIAEVANCQPNFVSIVLTGDADLNSDHAQAINKLIGHSMDESRYFHLMINHARAGTPDLRDFLEQEMAAIRERHLNLKQRLAPRDVIDEDKKRIYYSTWEYGAVRIALTIPGFRTLDPIANRLLLPRERVVEILEFLVENGLAERKGNEFFSTTRATHLGKDSIMSSQNHINWRMKMIQNMTMRSDLDLHYSSVISLSHKDRDKIRKYLIEAVTDVAEIVKPSKEEELCAFCIDFQRI